MNETDNDLVQRCKEIIDWSKTGLLAGGSGGSVRALAERLQSKVGEAYALRVAEDQTKDDAMREIIRLAVARPATESSLPALWQAIIAHTHGDMFWMGEILLNEITKETGFTQSSAQRDTTETRKITP